MRILSLSAFLLTFLLSASCQQEKSIYDSGADAKKELAQAIGQAKGQNKNVLIQVGGNWCPWCIKMHRFMKEQRQVDSIINADYIFLRVNYSKENKNLDVLELLEYPQRFGFPVMVVLDGNGKRLHTQDTGFLEENDGYSLRKFMTFLKKWNVSALDPGEYK